MQMKVTPNKNDNKKRKRDDIKEAISESPKKAKVHAQRKFAQGATLNNSVITPIKDKFRPSTAAQSSGPMLTTKCPNTEDFLTFLCFRRTSILPPKLDFFKEARGTENNSSLGLSKLHIDKNNEYGSLKKPIIKKNVTNDIKKKIQPATMQALRKKYQEQRLARHKVTNVTKLAQKVKGKNMVRTRSSVIVEEIKTMSKTRVTNKESTTALPGLRSGLKRIQPSVLRPIKKVVKPKHLRTGLRSSSLNVRTLNVNKVIPMSKSTGVNNNKKIDKDQKKLNVEVSQIKTKNIKLRKAEGFSDFSSDDNEPLLAVKKAKLTPKKPAKTSTEAPLEKKEEIKTFVKTRSQVVESEAIKIVRPTRKTKEAAALYVEMISKKLVSPEKSGDDDVSSVDSFPELPNAKKNEQRESEIKAKALANKKTTSKVQEQEKGLNNKKFSIKKLETPKSETVSLKEEHKSNKRTVQISKKETNANVKQECDAVPAKRLIRSYVKNKLNDEDEKDKGTLFHRPSTRSRSQEGLDHANLKLPARNLGNKLAKTPSSNESLKSEKSSLPNKSVKVKVKSKNIKTNQKKGLVEDEKNRKLLNIEKQEKQNKEIKEDSLKNVIKHFSEEEKDLAKEENTKKSKKVSSEIKTESKITDKEKMDKKESKSESITTKRPVRKCSAADKICFGIDTFTSDEDDFGASKITTTRSSTKKGGINTEKEKCKKEEEKKLKVVRDGKGTIKANTTAKEDLKKIEEKHKKEENKISKENVSHGAECEVSQEKGNNLINNDTQKKDHVTEKKEGASASSKRMKLTHAETIKDNAQTNEVKFSKIECGNFKTSERNKEIDSISIPNFCKKGNLHQSPLTADESTPEKNDVKKVNEKKMDDKREESKKVPIKIKGRNKESLKNMPDTHLFAVAERGGNEKPTRPVRQCSKGQKKWIETDSDSFSFYETSDDDDENNFLFELSYPKNKEKFGLEKLSKNDKECDNPGQIPEIIKEEKGLFKKNKDQDYGKNENFSDSDEEPLKKKAGSINLGVENSTKGTIDATDSNAAIKVQRHPPGLHPLKKMTGETSMTLNTTISKQPPQSAVANSQQVSLQLPCTVTTSNQASPNNQKSKKSSISMVCSSTEIVKEDLISTCPDHLFADEINTSMSVPDRIEMILNSLKKEALQDVSSSHSNNVNVTFENVPYHFAAHSSHVTSNQCSYQGKPIIKIPPPREPISTHGLDLLSEVALPMTQQNKVNSQTERIEKWLKDSLAAEHKKSFSVDEDNLEFKTGERDMEAKINQERSEFGFYCGKSLAPLDSTGHSEVQKFGQAELTASQKLLKKNLIVAEVGKIEPQPLAVKKAMITSVQDLLKLQKERKETTKSSPENSKHLKNCKCNNCVVKKGWFKNKPLPKLGESKTSSSVIDEGDQSLKPFESLTKAFKMDQSLSKVIAKGKNSKMSVCVAPILVNSSGTKIVTSDLPSPSSIPSGSGKSNNQRKGIFQQRKMSFLERMKERERKESAVAKANPNAFSPNNESSVYAFEPESDVKATANDLGKTKSKTASKSGDECQKVCEDETLTTTSSGTQVEKHQAEDKIIIGKSSQSASIAVQVNLDSESLVEVESSPELQDSKSIEISTQTEVPEEDSDSPMFYIPLQQSTTPDGEGLDEQQLIQGVALKLGTEGPKGPNQRVVMKAKLVTKPSDVASIKAVVMPQPKRIFDQKNSNPPIGTVQPTTRKPPEEPKKTEIAIEAKSTKSPTSTSTSLKSSTSFSFKMTEPPAPTKQSAKNKEKAKDQCEIKDKPKIGDLCSPSSSTLSKTKRTSKQKGTDTTVHASNSAWLPPANSTSKMVEAPTFYATEKDFQDPFEFFEKIRPAAENFGLCRIVPPNTFKPDCKVSDDMRFTAYNQYVHRMFHRWGPNIKEMMAIKKYLATQSISLKQPPWIGGIEVDLPRLYLSVQNCGGLMKVMEKKKWNQVADMMRIPKAAQDRVTKLDDIYCKYLLPYDTLSHDERQKLFDEVEKDWEERQKVLPDSMDSQGEDDGEEDNYIEECEECVVRGRNMALNQFYRIARNTMTMWFKNADPSPREVENEFWKHVSERNHHVCVHSGSIDSSGWGYGFPIAKNNSFSKHPWNLKVLTNNSRSVLRSLGPAMGVTVPTLHVGMVFAAFCWYRDPHGLPWIEYLHTGAPKIWYGISDDNSSVFQEALRKLLPRYIKNKTIWLPSDTAMIPPGLLVDHGVSLSHTVQEPGQFILVFPRAFISSICTGYMVSESVYFAQLSWLTTAEQAFKDIQESCEPSMFSLEKLLFSIATDSRSSVEVLKQVLPMVWHVKQKEIDGRKTLFNLGLKTSEKMPSREGGNKKKKGRWMQDDEGDYECEVCRTNLFVSLVINSDEEGTYCLPHAIELLTQKRHQLKFCKLLYAYSQEEMNDLVEKLEQRIESKSLKKPSIAKSSTTPK